MPTSALDSMPADTRSVTRLKLAVIAHWGGTQQGLARRCGIDNGQLSHYVRGDWRITQHHRAILGHVLGVAPEQLDGFVAGDDIWRLIRRPDTADI